ncbi:MAG TPA: PEPxxWA-CTERM sorting domain-containing protein [Phenylobacterium sp.]|nr:PEPxxWA-CTERM sorting domain-containing protein [Phenylobacterium sp.]
MKFKTLALAASMAIGALGLAAPASAAINAPVPVANYIVFGGLDWAWAAPCAPYAPSCGSDALTAYQASQGWRFPSLSEFNARPAVADFVAAGSPCASAYFGSGYSHCDYSDASSGYIFAYGYGVLGANGANPAAETWFVRGAGGNGGVPEPATWAMMIVGFGLAGVSLRRRDRVAA